MTDRLQEIKERYEVLPNEKWVSTDDSYGMFHVWPNGFECDMIARCKDSDVAIFIARAREDVPWLVAEVERLRKALEIYANSENWHNDTVDIGVGSQEIPDTSFIANDDGKIAREVLKT